MANTVIVTTRCANENVDSYNRKAKSTTDLMNGAPVALAFPKNRGDEVFTATNAVAGAKNVYLTYSPEVNKLVVGQVWGGDDPRNFMNLKEIPFDCFKPQVGDIIQVSKEFFISAKDPDTVTNSTVVELVSGGFESKVTATASYGGISFNIGRKEPLVIASKNVLTSEMNDAYLLECTQN